MTMTDVSMPVQCDESTSDLRLLDLKTPCYVLDPTVVLARFADLRARLGTPLIVSLKANPNLDLLIRCGHAFTDGIELASIGELDIVAGRINAPKYVNNPSMDEVFMRAALASRCTFIIDSLEQAQRLIKVIGTHPAPNTVLRLNAGLLVASGKHPADHFGMSQHDALLTAGALAQANVPVIGLHTFAGSNSFHSDDTGAADLAHALAAFALHIARLTGMPIEFLNVGGGFADHYASQPHRFEAYRQRIAPLQRAFKVVHESGRGIFAGAGTFVTRVRSVKALGERYVAVCDGGLSHNFLLAKTESMLKKYATPRVLRRQPPPVDSAHLPIQFVGSTCSRADVIGWSDGVSAPPNVGDLVIFDNCGAYNQTYSVSGFLSQGSAHTYIHES